MTTLSENRKVQIHQGDRNFTVKVNLITANLIRQALEEAVQTRLDQASVGDTTPQERQRLRIEAHEFDEIAKTHF